MDVRSLPAYLESELRYPVTHADVIEQIGTVRIATPRPDEHVEIGAVLAQLNETQYDTPEELYTSIIGSLGDAFIGRKFYDDRGTNPIIVTDPDATTPEQESF